MTEFATNLSNNNIILLEELDTTDGMNSFLQLLLIHGWCQIQYTTNSSSIFSSSFSSLLSNWEEIFTNAFSLDDDIKINAGKYRIEENVAIGYRRDETREFMETRLISKFIDKSNNSSNNDWMNCNCSPSFPQVEKYDDTVINMIKFLSHIVAKCLKGISKEMGLDEDFLLDLTDISNGIGINKQKEEEGEEEEEGEGEEVEKQEMESQLKCKSSSIPLLSSTLLRICRYPSGKHSAATEPGEDDIAFGSHTDTSLLTIAPHSTIAGLEIRDNLTKEWIMPETTSIKKNDNNNDDNNNDSIITIFTGEMLQCLSKHKFKAVVHRVRAPINDNTCRISCPLIVRANGKAIFNPLNERYAHSGGTEAVEGLPDLDGVKMTLIQKILDMKRAKRVKQHTDTDNNIDWILKAYDSDVE